jgi:DNA processing protein
MLDMYDRMSLLAYVNDKDISRNIHFITSYFHNSTIPDFIAGIENSISNKEIAIHPRELLHVCEKIRKSLSEIDLSIYTEEIRKIQLEGIRLIAYDSEQYPEKLREIPDPPLLLYQRGSLTDFHNCIAIVGTRSPSIWGKKTAYNLAGDLVSEGYTISGGLAAGIDTEAHRGALAAGGKTVAILAGPIEDIYPRQNIHLAHEIIASGSILSEVSSFVKVHRGRFISRNRLTSGISRCVIAVESPGGGGTYQQVRVALSQQRPVLICTPNKDNHSALKGFHELRKMGAIPIQSVDDVLDIDHKITRVSNTMTLNDYS